MTTNPSTRLSHPLVVAYLNDLERALATADPQERLDTLTSVTEHLAEALGEGAPTTEHVQAVLDDLGSVEQIAAAATPAPPAPAVAEASAQAPTRKDWVPPALLATAIVSLVLPLIGALLALACIVTAALLLRADSPRRPLLVATIAVSVLTLLVTGVILVTNIAWSGMTFESTSTSVVATQTP